MLRRAIKRVAAIIAASSIAAGVIGLSAINQRDGLPNHRLTPGDVMTTDLEQIREPNYSKSVRNVSESEKVQVALRYRLDPAKLKDCEVDHLIPLSWGGSNAIENLWPEPYAGTWNARVKDRLEVHGLAMIRRGELDLRTSQHEIASDWKGMYRRLISKQPAEHMSAEHGQ